MVGIKNTNKRPKKVVNKDTKQKKEALNNKKTSQKTGASKGFYYSFFTVLLVLCLTQVAVSAVVNVSKVISYKAKIVQIQKTRDTALALNEQLNDNIKNYSNVAGSEAIARNNLKMSSADEVLVIIHSNKNEDAEETNKKSKNKK